MIVFFLMLCGLWCAAHLLQSLTVLSHKGARLDNGLLTSGVVILCFLALPLGLLQEGAAVLLALVGLPLLLGGVLKLALAITRIAQRHEELQALHAALLDQQAKSAAPVREMP